MGFQAGDEAGISLAWCDTWQHREEVEASLDPTGQFSGSIWEETGQAAVGTGGHRGFQLGAVDTCSELSFHLGGSPQTQNGTGGIKQGRAPS